MRPTRSICWATSCWSADIARRNCWTRGWWPSATSGGHYDRFRNRLVFPIRDAKGMPVGFGGRALGNGRRPSISTRPSRSSSIKANILYGFDLARPHIQRSGQVVIVEGYMDVVVAHQAGQHNVVGTIRHRTH